MVEAKVELLEPALRGALGGKEAYDHQIRFGREVLASNNAVLSAGTGSGKTEAALVPALLTEKRVFLLYPTKALLQDQYERVKKIAVAVPGGPRRILVDTGDEEDPTGYSADIILTNLDKFVYRLFGYGKRRWGYIYPYRLMHDDRKPLLVFDEAHAYEETIFSHFWFVLNKLTYERNVQTLLLSATLPESFVELLRDERCEKFPRLVDEGDFFSIVEDGKRRGGRQFYKGTVSLEETLTKAADLFGEGRRVAIILRRISGKGGLQEAWESLRGQLGERMACIEDGSLAGWVFAYHGGQLPRHRQRVLDRLLALNNTREPYLLLATHAMEVGVDISAEVMFCGAGRAGFLLGPDGFVQQIGRCARRKEEDGDVYLMVEEDGGVPKFAEVLKEGGEISLEIKTKINSMNEPPSVEVAERSVEYLHNESLYRYVYDYVPENAELWERGTLVTRDWEPTIEMVFAEERNGETLIGGIPESRFWRGEKIEEQESFSLSVRQAANLALRCAWVFTGQDEDNDATIRLALGGEKKRTLDEVLGRLGYPINPNRPQDARQIPLMLLMPQKVREDDFSDDNLGVTVPAVKREDAETSYRHPNIRRFEVTFKKSNPSTRLVLRWEEPRREEE